MTQYNAVAITDVENAASEIEKGAFCRNGGNIYLGASIGSDENARRIIGLEDGNRWRDDNSLEDSGGGGFTRIPKGTVITTTVGETK